MVENKKIIFVLCFSLIFVYENSAVPFQPIMICVSDINIIHALEDFNNDINELNIAKANMPIDINEVDIDDNQEPFDFDTVNVDIINKMKIFIEKTKNVYMFLNISELYEVINLQQEMAIVAFQQNLGLNNKKVELMTWNKVIKKHLDTLSNIIDNLCRILTDLKTNKKVVINHKNMFEQKFIINIVISEMFMNNENIEKTIEFINTNDCRVRFSGFETLLQKNGKINEYYMKLTYAIRDYLSSCNPAQEIGITLKKYIPTCIQNAVFSNEVCVKNAQRSEYLITDIYKASQTAHLVFTWIPRQIVPQAKWKIVMSQNEKYVHFVNSLYNNQLIASSLIQGKIRRTHTDNNNGDNALWDIESDGSQCYIKNKQFSEYLYSTTSNFCPERRHVVTLTSKSEFAKWEIESC